MSVGLFLHQEVICSKYGNKIDWPVSVCLRWLKRAEKIKGYLLYFCTFVQQIGHSIVVVVVGLTLSFIYFYLSGPKG